VEAEIRVCGGDDVAELAALWDWLRAERALAGAVRLSPRSPGPADLGAGYDLLAVALGSGGAGAALARSLAAWLRTRRPDVAITVTVPSGSITVEARRVRDGAVMPLLAEVLQARDEP